MDAKDIFISYKSEEYDVALWIKNTLESKGISCWMAPESISGGASYASEIPAAIKNCKVFVIVLSAKAQESIWIPRELDQAINANKRIMPFMVENCGLKSDFEFYLSNVQRYYAYLGKEDTMERMLLDIKDYIGFTEPEAPNETQPAPEGPKQEQSQPEVIRKSEQSPKAPDAAKKSKRKGGKKAVIITLSIAMAMVALIITSVLLSMPKKVVFADTVFKADDYTVKVEDKEIDADDLASLSEFESLRFLELNNCTFKTDNVSALINDGLLELRIVNCNLTDVQFGSLDFSTAEKLTGLDLNGNKDLTDLTAVAPLADTLTTLKINDIPLSSLDFIKDFESLEELSVDRVGVSDLSALSEAIYLEKLSAEGNGIETLNGLENTTVLSSVSIADNSVSDVSVLANSADTLKYLNLDNNSISDLSALSVCKNIVSLSANSNQLADVDWLTDWQALQTLSLANNKIETISGRINSPKLLEADFSSNMLTEVSGVVFQTDGYVKVRFDNNSITAVALPADCYFTTLALHGNPLESDSFLNEINGSCISLDYFDGLSAQALADCSIYDIYVVDCPANRKVELSEASFFVEFTTAGEVESLIFD